MKRSKLIKRFFVYVAIRCVAGLLLALPFRAALALGAFGGRVAHLVARRARLRAVRQIEEALGLDPHAARALARRVFAHAGLVAAEIALLDKIREHLPRYVELEAEDRARLEEARAGGRGVLVVSAHLGNWELLAQRIARAGFDAATLARKSSNPFLAEWLLETRRRGGVETINRGDPRSARRMLSALRRGALLGALLDQDTRVDSVHVPFFGRPAATPTVAAELALRREIPIFACFIRRRDRFGHRITVERVELEVDPSLPRASRVRAVTLALTRAIENAVRERPEEWVWFHARWKTPPPPG